MTLSRRCFVRFGQLLFAAAALPVRMLGVRPGNFLNKAEAEHLFSRQRFLPFVNSSFAVRRDSEARTWMTLLSVDDTSYKTPAYAAPMAVQPKGSPVSPLKFDAFALRFHGTGEALTQDTYEVEHPSLGNFALFLVPAGESRYVAVINRERQVAGNDRVSQ